MRDGQPGALGGSTIRVWPVHWAAWFPLRGLPLQAPDGPGPSPALGSEEEDPRTRVMLLLGEERKSKLTSYENSCFACLHNEPELTGSVEECVALECVALQLGQTAPGSLAEGSETAHFSSLPVGCSPGLNSKQTVRPHSSILQKAALVASPQSRSCGSLGHTRGSVGVSFWSLLSVPGSQFFATTCGQEGPSEIKPLGDFQYQV